MPQLDPTEWGIPALDDTAFHAMTFDEPTALDEYSAENRIEWLDPVSGGVFAVFNNSGPIIRSTRFDTHHAQSGQEIEFLSSLVDGDVPWHHRWDWQDATARHLGFRVLTKAEDVGIVQLPGIRDYETAFNNVNGQRPLINVDQIRAGSIKGQEFLSMVSEEGLWPYDMHFYRNHAPALIIGGIALSEEIMNMASQSTSSRRQIDDIGLLIDRYASIIVQVREAKARLHAYLESENGDPAILLQKTCTELADLPSNPHVMAAFNLYVADDLQLVINPDHLRAGLVAAPHLIGALIRADNTVA